MAATIVTTRVRVDEPQVRPELTPSAEHRIVETVEQAESGGERAARADATVETASSSASGTLRETDPVDPGIPGSVTLEESLVADLGEVSRRDGPTSGDDPSKMVAATSPAVGSAQPTLEVGAAVGVYEQREAAPEHQLELERSGGQAAEEDGLQTEVQPSPESRFPSSHSS